MKQQLQKHTLKLRKGQYDRLRDLHPNIPTSEIIRRILAAYIEKAEKNLGAARAPIDVEFDLDAS